MPSYTQCHLCCERVCLDVQENRQLRLEGDEEMYARRLQLERAEAEHKAAEAHKRYLKIRAASSDCQLHQQDSTVQPLHLYVSFCLVASLQAFTNVPRAYSLAETHAASSLSDASNPVTQHA